MRTGTPVAESVGTMHLRHFADAARAIGSTTKKLEKEKLLAEYLHSLDDASLERAVVFFAGSPFPRKDERTTGVGWSTIFHSALEATGADSEAAADAAIREGDLGDGIVPMFGAAEGGVVTILELGEVFDRLAATPGNSAKQEILTSLFARVRGDEARIIVKILQNELRIGLNEGLVESAVAKAFGRKVADLRRAHMLNGDLGVTALLAKSDALDSAKLTMFHPIGFMLAQPEETAADIFAQLGAGAAADDKYDGIRAQLHFDGSSVRIYSRTLDEITARFPEVAAAARELPHEAILDGEIVAFDGHVLPFAQLQPRIGRRKLSEKLLSDAPAVFFVFDFLFDKGDSLLDEPLSERLRRMRGVIGESGSIRRGYQRIVSSAEEIDLAFDEARARANEGLVVKALDSFYTPGRRGKTWLKYKKALATLDCVITAAEYGHGKRRGVLSDYTFAIRSDDKLLNIGKAYSGVTDAEITMLTEKLTALTTDRHGPVHVVHPEIVLEIAFDRINESKRHKSGYALRFPRIANVRLDKSVTEISTIDDVRRIYEGQLVREKPS